MRGGLLVILFVVAPASARAQESCPGAQADASAAEQALCWFDRASDGGDEATSLEHARTHCVDAALDEPRVAEACFLAPLRLRRFAEALEAFEYVSSPSAELTRCAGALRDVLPLQILSAPEGAAIEVDGTPVGTAPVEVRLATPWWERSIAARFGETRVEVGAAELAAAFDTNACAMSHLAVHGPERAAADPDPDPDPDPPLAGPDPGLVDDDGGAAIYEEWWFWTLIAVVVVGAAVGTTLGVVLTQPMFELGSFD